MLIALTIFALAYVAIVSEKFPRHLVALIGGALLIVFGILSPMEAFAYINWDTLGLLAGMFVLVSILHESGFFAWLSMKSLRAVNYHPSYLFAALLLMAAGLSMIMASITVMLFLAALTLPLCRLLKVDPVTFIIAEVCAANTGGSATLVGNPPNVILGTTLGFNFGDFAANLGPISALAALLLLGIFYWSNRKALRSAHKLLTPETVAEIESVQRDPLHARMTRIGLAAFGIAVLLLVTYNSINDATGWALSAGMLAMAPAGLALVLLPGGERKSVILRVDGESIVFFAGLFVLIGGLEKARVFDSMATFLAATTAGNPVGLVMALHWVPGLLSGVVDNVPLALAMSYVLRDLSHLPGMPALGLMVWSLALGVNMGGNLTPIGASANVVAYTFMEKNHGPVGWRRWMTAVWAPTLVTMLLATGLVFIKGRLGWF